MKIDHHENQIFGKNILQSRYLIVLCLLIHVVLPFRFRFANQQQQFPLTPSVHHKRSYVELKCRGMYDPSIFAKLSGICEDCYNLYRDPEVHGMCRFVLLRLKVAKNIKKTPFFLQERLF